MRLSLSRRLFALAALVALLPATPARAEAEGEGKKVIPPPMKVLDEKTGKLREATPEEIKAAAAAAGHGEHEKGGLDFTGIKRWDLGLYTLIVFGLLMFVLAKYAWPHIKEGLEKRETNIRSALDEARREREQAQAALTEAKKQLDAAAAEVKARFDETRREAEALKAQQREEGVKEAGAIVERARREIAAEADAQRKELRDETVKLATMMAEKALGRSVSIDDHRRLLDESIAELKNSNGKA